MIIKIPRNFIPERTYIIDIIFYEFLGLDYNIIYYNEKDYEIELDNKNILVIKDHFFSNYNENTFSYNENILPQNIRYITNQFTIEKNIPVIYGSDQLEITGNKIICGMDIFASSFFMLTRWEEYANKNKDSHGRFSAYDSASFKNNFLNRPVVNEYIEMIWNMMEYLKCNRDRRQWNLNIIPTHDVDQPLWSNRSILKRTLKDLLSKNKSQDIYNNIQLHFKSRSELNNDPFNTYDFLMNLSEKYNVKSHFFFSSSKKSKFDIGYDIKSKFIKKLIEGINARGHIVGFHPGYNSYMNKKIWEKEFKKLSVISKNKIDCGRQHYLRFELPATWQIWENNGMDWDSTMTYHDKEGFRCGTCYEFSVFNILTRNKLKLKEKPLIVMEGSFFQYQDLSTQDIIQKILDLKNIIRKYKGNFVFLWHNSSFNVAGYENNKMIYEEIIK